MHVRLRASKDLGSGVGRWRVQGPETSLPGETSALQHRWPTSMRRESVESQSPEELWAGFAVQAWQQHYISLAQVP